ncbi:Protein fantom [Thoreauomyces humboldtii]|nr:Protein fantom [Thoreauomyces humboldtii]
MNDQDEKSKRLVTKVQRLTEDLKRAKVPVSEESAFTPTPGRAVISRREAAEVDDMVEDLRGQLRMLAKDNSHLKNKMNFFKSLHEAETRKGARYDHIPPRINSGVKKLQPSLVIRRRAAAQAADDGNTGANEENLATSEDVARLEELVTMLRGKLVDAERQSETTTAENQRLTELLESRQQQSDIERLTHQRANADLQKRLQEALGKGAVLEETHRALGDAHAEALKAVETLTEELKEERRRRIEAEARLGAAGDTTKRIEELATIIADLRAEKKLLEDEQARLLAAQFGTGREEEWERERASFLARIKELEGRAGDSLKEATDLHATIAELRGKLSAAQKAKQEAEASLYNVQHMLDELQSACAFLNDPGPIDWVMVRDAVALWKSRGADMPSRVQDLGEEKRLLQELWLQYTRCIEDLERTRKLLELQERINKDYKLELAQLNGRLESIKNDYEMRIEEHARLLDIRGNRIAFLEAQLKSLAYGVVKVPEATKESDDDVELEKGQNLLTIAMNGALITPEGSELLGGSKRLREALATFVYFDFFDYETAVGPVVPGLAPRYGFAAKYRVFIDDFCLMYLQSQPVIVYLCTADGLDFTEVAKCTIRFRNLVSATRAESTQYYADLVSMHDHKTVIGRLDYTIAVRLPMSQAVRAFKERTVALNLLTVGEESVDTSNRFGTRGGVNELVVAVHRCTSLDLTGRDPSHGVPAVYVAFQLPGHDHAVTSTVRGSTDPEFSYLRSFRVHTTPEIKKAWSSKTLILHVLDDTESDHQYGTAEIPLAALAAGEAIEGSYDIQNSAGTVTGSLHLSLSWERPLSKDGISTVIRRVHGSANDIASRQRPPAAPSSRNPSPPPSAPAPTLQLHPTQPSASGTRSPGQTTQRAGTIVVPKPKQPEMPRVASGSGPSSVWTDASDKASETANDTIASELKQAGLRVSRSFHDFLSKTAEQDDPTSRGIGGSRRDSSASAEAEDEEEEGEEEKEGTSEPASEPLDFEEEENSEHADRFPTESENSADHEGSSGHERQQ